MKSSDVLQEELELEEESTLPSGFLDECLKTVGWDRKVPIEYLSGFFDGEGCITIVAGSGRFYFLRIFLSNTNEDVLRNLQRAYGGRLDEASIDKTRFKPAFKLIWQGWRAADILEQMLPHLIVKTPQARLALEFWKFAQRPMNERCSDQVVVCGKQGLRTKLVRTAETKRIEADFKQRMHALNRRGAL